MSKYSQDKIRELDAQISRLMAIYPNISAAKIAETLHLDHWFVCKRKKKIERANTENIRRMTIDQDLGEIRQFLNATLPEIAKIIFAKESKEKDKINALKVLLEGKKVFLDKKFDAGIFERQLGRMKTDTTLSEEDRKVVEQALEYAFNPEPPTKDSRGD
jgi:hypothetical protein